MSKSNRHWFRIRYVRNVLEPNHSQIRTNLKSTLNQIKIKSELNEWKIGLDRANFFWGFPWLGKTLYRIPLFVSSTFCNDANLSATLMVVWRIDVCKKDHWLTGVQCSLGNSHFGSIICRVVSLIRLGRPTSDCDPFSLLRTAFA